MIEETFLVIEVNFVMMRMTCAVIEVSGVVMEIGVAIEIGVVMKDICPAMEIGVLMEEIGVLMEVTDVVVEVTFVVVEVTFVKGSKKGSCKTFHATKRSLWWYHRPNLSKMATSELRWLCCCC